MNTALYIAKKMGGEWQKGSRIVRTSSAIVAGSVALSICVIVIALSIVGGFRKEIRERVTGFAGQVIVAPFGVDYINDAFPLSTELSYLHRILACNNVSHTQYFAFKRGLIKTDIAMQGIVIKGVGKEFDRSFFTHSLHRGTFPQWNDTLPSMELLISKRMADALALDVSQHVDVYFIDQSATRVRRFTVSGIYDAALEEVDLSLVIGDIRVVQRLNNWTPMQVGGIELTLHRPEQMEATAGEVREVAARYATGNDQALSVKTVKDIFSHLFDWLNLIDTNLLIVLLLMVAVAGVNMVSGLLIMLFDKTSMIGVLKAVGMKNRDIRLTFIYRMGRLVLWGMLIGNVVAITLCLIQQKYTLITLDQANYAVPNVPIYLHFWNTCAINLLAFALIILFMLLTTTLISRISPERSLRVK